MRTSACTYSNFQVSAREGTIAQAPGAGVIHLDGALEAPLKSQLQHQVCALLRAGHRAIAVDLARVPSIDAAGIGELIRAYNMTMAAGGALRIRHATPWVREMLERVRLFELLTLGVVTA